MNEWTSISAIPAEIRASANVAVVQTRADRDRVVQDVRKAMTLAKWKQFISPGAEVSLKVNLGWDKLIPGSISAPWVVEGVVQTIQDYVHQIYIVESDQIVVDVEKAFLLSNLRNVCERYNVRWINLSKGEFIRIKDPSRMVLKDINLPRLLLQTELITIPLMKTHNKTTITGALKNQWGCLETLRHNFHLVLPEAIADVNALVQPRFAVMDGTVGLEGDGPKSGRPKEMNLVLASGNLVGIDATAAWLMGFDPQTIQHLLRCSEHGFGSVPERKSVIGSSIEEVSDRFTPARHNVVSWVEFALRRSFFQWLIFRTPILNLMTWGASRYYDLWDHIIGRRIRNEFFSTSKYALQWEHPEHKKGV